MEITKTNLGLGAVTLLLSSSVFAGPTPVTLPVCLASDLSFNGSDASSCSGVNSGNDDVSAINAAFWSPADGDLYTQIIKDDNPGSGSDTGSFGGIDFTLAADAGGAGDWILSWSGANLPATIDFVAGVKAGTAWSAYEFNDQLLNASPNSSGTGTWDVTWLNRGGNTPDLSHFSLYGANLTPTTTVGVPEPSTIALLGMGLLALGLTSRRKRLTA